MYTPADLAKLLKIAAPTLRRWSSDLAPLLSTRAKRPGAAGRRYTDDDLALLKRYQALIHGGATYDQAKAQLVAAQRGEEPAHEAVAVDVEIMQPSDQQQAIAAFVEAQRALIESQREHIADQAQLIGQLQTKADADHQAIVDATAALERARADEAQALASLRQTLNKIPRWLRGLLGLGA